MSPSPKTPDEKKLPDEENSFTEEFSHPQNHLQHEYNASTDESNSDDDNTNQQHENTNGYCLLPQDFDLNQQENEYDSENEDDEFLRFATLRVHASVNENETPPVSNTPARALESVWSSKLESESFPVDDDKANYIKTLMSSIKLPESSVPTWAQYCSEQDWKEKLQEKISCRQTTFFLNEKN